MFEQLTDEKIAEMSFEEMIEHFKNTVSEVTRYCREEYIDVIGDIYEVGNTDEKIFDKRTIENAVESFQEYITVYIGTIEREYALNVGIGYIEDIEMLKLVCFEHVERCLLSIKFQCEFNYNKFREILDSNDRNVYVDEVCPFRNVLSVNL